MGRMVSFRYPPQRIISLVPSQTELLFDLGLDKEIVGITHFCIHPSQKVNAISKIGGTKRFKFDVIESLEPDLIIGNKEENYKDGIEYLIKKFPVWMSDVKSLQQAVDMINSLGNLTQRNKKAREIIDQIHLGFQNLEKRTFKRVLYFIWRRPYMAAGQDTFINEMLTYCGFYNGLPEKSRYPELTEDQIRDLNPDLILLSSEPFPFGEKHITEFKSICPEVEIRIVNGQFFSWYGSRLQYAPQYFEQLQRSVLA
ncbi:cobalamin-binding protein [Cytophagales bacterium RKSG123]|nr:cobalamin-binding protein [Xanthovirga aplysinae]